MKFFKTSTSNLNRLETAFNNCMKSLMLAETPEEMADDRESSYKKDCQKAMTELSKDEKKFIFDQIEETRDLMKIYKYSSKLQEGIINYNLDHFLPHPKLK